MTDLPDIQKTAPRHAKPIRRVGIKNLKMPIRVKISASDDGLHPNAVDGFYSTVADVSAYVSLPAHEKGTHMSRMSLAFQGAPVVSTDFFTLAERVRESCGAAESELIFTFPFFYVRRAPISRIAGVLHANVSISITREHEPDQVQVMLTVETKVTSLCPCSKEISFPEGAHNQRGSIKITLGYTIADYQVSLAASLDGANGPAAIEDIIAIAESCGSSRLYSVLKRPDEKYVTQEAYKNPMFVEDMVREAYIKMEAHAAKFKDIPLDWFTVEVTNEESIHLHDAYASMSSLENNSAP